MDHAITHRALPDIAGVTMGWYGRRGVGKTAAALGTPFTGAGMPAPLVLSCEAGEDAFAGVDVWATPTAQELRRAVLWVVNHCDAGRGGRLVPRRDFPYRSILVDGLSTVYGETADEGAGRSVMGAGGATARADGYGVEHRDAIAMLMPIVRALKLVRLPVVITMHQREWTWPIMEAGRDGRMWQKRDAARQPVVGRGTAPDLAPRFRELVENQLDVLAYCYRDEETGERLFLASEVIEPQRRIHAKDRYFGAIGTVANPDYGLPPARGLLGPSGLPVDQPRIPAPRPLAWSSFADPLRAFRESYRESAPAEAEPPPVE